MNAATKQVYDHALRLNDKERAELAAWLIDSLDRETDDAVDAAWEAEIKSRIDELDSGKVAAVPWPEARRMILGLSDAPVD
jgi:putative addiction module component (TIGR02574 family)